MLKSICVAVIGLFIAISLSLGTENIPSSVTSKMQTGRYQAIMEDKNMPLILDTATGKIWVRRIVKDKQFVWLCYDLPNEIKPEDRMKWTTSDDTENSSAEQGAGKNYSATSDPDSVFYKGNK